MAEKASKAEVEYIDLEKESSLTEAELHELRIKARAQIVHDLKEQKKKEALERLRIEALSEADPSEEMVRVTINVPEYATIRGDRISGIRINGKEYLHGTTHSVPRRVAESLYDVMWMADKHARAYLQPRSFRLPTAAVNGGGETDVPSWWR